MKLLLCFGTRPEAIKMAPLYHALQASAHHVKVVVTAQHRSMLDQVLDFFGIRPDFDLNSMQPNQTLNGLSAKILTGMETVFSDFTPDLVLVHGDTTTSSMVALAAFHKQIPVAHVEAGLRTHNLQSPFPEEMNRQLTAKLANYHFAPTPQAEQNLRNEGIAPQNILITGNTVVDALLWANQKVQNNYQSPFTTTVSEWLNTAKQMVLITGHRRENFGEGMLQLAQAIKQLALQFPEVVFVYPVHLNPKVQEPMQQHLQDIANVHLIAPLSYPDFVFAMTKASCIISDSGGIQEEAPSLGKPVVVLRTTTERPEAVACGAAFLTGTNPKAIVDKVTELLQTQTTFTFENPYGDGKASEKIVAFLNQLPA